MAKALFLGLLTFGMSTWVLLILYFSPLLPSGWRLPVVALYVTSLLALFLLSSRRWSLGPLAVAIIAFGVTALYLSLKPKQAADWKVEFSVPTQVSFESGSISLEHVRDFEFANGEVAQDRRVGRRIDLQTLVGVDFLISYWDEERAVAHTMMSFQFESEEALCISVEARRERGESWNVLPGLFRQYELYYVIGTERDLIGQRIYDRGETVYRFRTRLSPKDGQDFLVNMLEAAERTRREPVFYQTISNNCTTTLVEHLNQVWPDRAPYRKRLWLNGYTPKHAWDAGLIASDLPFDEYVAASEVSLQSLPTRPEGGAESASPR